MTSTKDVAIKVEEWVADVLGINTFPEDPEDLNKSLPLVVGDVQRKRKVASDSSMPVYQHEQRDLRLWIVRATLMVHPDPSWTQTQVLYDFVDELDVALTKDKTLGGRVEAVSGSVDAEFPGELEHPSGVVALGAFFQITIGESAEV